MATMTHEELLRALEKTLGELRPKAAAGDDDARVELAMGKALHAYMRAGGKLTDLEWFKGTRYYTGDTGDDALGALPKAA